MVTLCAVDKNEEAMDRLFSALAHSTRRRILDVLRHRPGTNVSELASRFGRSHVAVLKHLRVLEQADLVISQRQGRERRLYFNPVPIEQVWQRWSDEYGTLWSQRLLDLKRRVEQGGSDDDANREEGVPGVHPRDDGPGVARADEDG
jgi:DNA-binding transcriptional ArsR family regulator